MRSENLNDRLRKKCVREYNTKQAARTIPQVAPGAKRRAGARPDLMDKLRERLALRRGGGL